MVTYAATLDVPRHVVEYLSRLLAAHRRRIGTPKGSRALGPFRQAVLVLRWFRERGCVHCLARDAGISQATGYRYLHEGIDVLADQAPDLHEVLDRCRRAGMTHVILDATLIESDRVAGVRDNGNDWWFSQKHKAFAGNVQFLSAPDGTPL
ncbi:MAG: transposase family protein [Actinomycetia bacterium]|nr:transposase family protein [Actinomycetes bacterium]